MTKLLKSVVRETAVRDGGDALVVELHPRTIAIRVKGRRGAAFTIPIEALYHQLCKARVEQDRREKLLNRRSA